MLTRRLNTLLCVAAATALAGPPALMASEVMELDGASAEFNALPGAWLVQLKSAPAADGTQLATLSAEREAFRAAAAKAGASFTERRVFETLWNGLSINASRSDINKIAALNNVAAVWPLAIIEAPTPDATVSPELFTALSMTGADIAQSELGFTGAGVKVAVMDTGIDYDHPDLGGGFGPGYRVAKGYDFVGDAYNADPSSLAFNPNPAPDAYPDDCNGHGTHVSGIVGANGTVKGVAPDVTFGAYRVFGCAGSTTADIMMAAMEAALADDMDVLNMSIGSSFQWPQYPTAEAADRLVNKGMVVVASIGNSGANGVYSAGAPGLGQKVIGTASFDNIAVTLNQFTISPDNTAIGYSTMTGSVAAPTSGSLPMARTGTPASTADACSALPAGSLAGTAALIRRGTCSFASKATNAQNAGAAAVVIYNNAAGRFAGTIAGSGVTIPTVQISDTEGVLINNRLAAGPVTLTWQAGVGSFPNPSGNLISSFSSYGLSPDLALKPDIGAPGGLIYSTYPLEAGGYATISGTSMASPHVAGAAALLLQAKPNTNSQILRTILQNSADPKVWSLNPGSGLLDHAHRQGAGMLDIDDAILATTKIEPGKIAAGEGEAGPYTQVLSVQNNGASSVTYNLSSVNAVSTGGTITPSFFVSNASVAFSAPSVTVPAGGTATFSATITPATSPTNGQYGGYIVLTDAADSRKVFRVPFAGFVGDYQGITVLSNSTFPTGPLLGKLNSCTPAALLRDNYCYGAGSYGVVPAGTTYSMANAYNIPVFIVHLEHQVRDLRVELFDSSGKAWHRAYDEDYVGRNSASSTFFTYPFDGATFAGNKTYSLPDGTYYAKISVLKALGDKNNPAHWETWTSPMFVIDRP